MYQFAGIAAAYAQGRHILVAVELLEHPTIARGNRHRAAAE
jgi:hypothetical protein